MAETDVLVVGAGPVGLALAIGLRLHGLSVRVVDRGAGPKDEPRAAVIWPRGAEVLDDLGLGETVAAEANALAQVHFHARGRRLGAAALGALDSRHPRPLLIEQHRTERRLAARLSALGVAVEWGTEALDLTQGAGDVEVSLRRTGTERARAAWLVGCDGAGSRVRGAAGIPFEGRRERNLAILQVDAVPRWPFPRREDEGFYFLAPGACLGCFPLPEGDYRFFCYVDDPAMAADGPPDLATMRALVARVSGVPDLQLEAPRWLDAARFQSRTAVRFRQGRILLAGDAAHVWPSLGGHGMNIGLRGAHNLAWKLAAVQGGGAPDALLDTYETEDRAATARFRRLMRFNFVERPSGAASFPARTALVRAGLALPGLGRRLERLMSDLDSAHDRSPLSAGRARGGIAPGARLPDTVVLVEGRRVRLHDLLGFDRWTLLASDAIDPAALGAFRQRAAEPVALRLVDASEAGHRGVRRLLAHRRALVLVRPDRHIGLVAEGGDMAAIDAYRARWIAPAP